MSDSETIPMSDRTLDDLQQRDAPLRETRQRRIGCMEAHDTAVLHPDGHVITEERWVTEWRQHQPDE